MSFHEPENGWAFGCLWLGVLLFNLAIYVAIIATVIHFARKFW